MDIKILTGQPKDQSCFAFPDSPIAPIMNTIDVNEVIKYCTNITISF